MTGSKVTAILMTKKCVYIINLFYKLMLDAFKGSETIDKKSLEYKEYVTQSKNIKILWQETLFGSAIVSSL